MPRETYIPALAEEKSDIVEFYGPEDFPNDPPHVAKRKAWALDAFMNSGQDWETALKLGKGRFSRKEVIGWLKLCPEFKAIVDQGNFLLANQAKRRLRELMDNAVDERVQLKAAEAIAKAYDAENFDSQYRAAKIHEGKNEDKIWTLLAERIKAAEILALANNDPFLRPAISHERKDDSTNS